MRYRSISATGMAVSAVALTLRDLKGKTKAADWRELIFAALENGINTFEIERPTPELLAGVAQAVGGVDRRLLYFALRAGARDSEGFSAHGLSNLVRATLQQTGLGYLNLFSVDAPPAGAVGPEALEMLRNLRGARTLRQVGVAGSDDAIDGWIATGAFDALIHPYNLSSGWRDRNRIKTATGAGMSVIACDAYSDDIAEASKAKPALSGLFKPKSGAAHGGYGFLENTPNWQAEEICLAYALTEPAVSTVLMQADRRDRIEHLAGVPERDLPTGVCAQIEMARFSPSPGPTERRRA